MKLNLYLLFCPWKHEKTTLNVGCFSKSCSIAKTTRSAQRQQKLQDSFEFFSTWYIKLCNHYEISILLSAWTVRAWTCALRPQQVPNISVTSWHMGQQLEVERLSLLCGNQQMIHLSLMVHYDHSPNRVCDPNSMIVFFFCPFWVVTFTFVSKRLGI